MDKISTIIINHNYGQWVNDAIDSAINQTYEGPITVYIVESASTDDSLSKISNRFFGKELTVPTKVTGFYKKINNSVDIKLIVLPENYGPSFARNLAINEALDSQYIAILDSDDIMSTEKLAKMHKAFQEHHMIGVVYADYEIFDLDKKYTHTEYKEPFDIFRLNEECIVHSGSMIKTKALIDTRDENGYYDVHMRTCEDYDLWMRISKKYMIYHIPESLTFVRNHNGNSTHTVDKQIWESNWLRIRQKNAQ